MKLSLYVMALLALACAVGCGEAGPPPEETTAQAPAPPAPAPPGNPNGASAASPSAESSSPVATTDALNLLEPADAMPAEETGAAAPGEDSPAEDSPAAGDTTAPAEVGVGVKGQDYGGPGFVTTPVEAYFRTGERIAFEIQIPSAMKLYKAAHDNKGPKTHEEFMNVIIRENGVDLPELREGEEFLYDPKTEQLLVRRPTE